MRTGENVLQEQESDDNSFLILASLNIFCNHSAGTVFYVNCKE